MTTKFKCQKFFTAETKVTEFDCLVYDACMQIPKGKISTYKSLAKRVGSPKAYRAVGSALKRNPFAPQVPCHRVVASNFSLGGFQGFTDPKGENLKKKVQMLNEEGVVLVNAASLSSSGEIPESVANIKVSSVCFYDFE